MSEPYIALGKRDWIALYKAGSGREEDLCPRQAEMKARGVTCDDLCNDGTCRIWRADVCGSQPWEAGILPVPPADFVPPPPPPPPRVEGLPAKYFSILRERMEKERQEKEKRYGHLRPAIWEKWATAIINEPEKRRGTPGNSFTILSPKLIELDWEPYKALYEIRRDFMPEGGMDHWADISYVAWYRERHYGFGDNFRAAREAYTSWTEEQGP